MDTVVGPSTSMESSSQEQETVDSSTPNGKAESPAEMDESQGPGTNDEATSGRKAFKFGRLKEEASLQSSAAELEDSSVIIANPAYLEGSRKKQKRAGGRKKEQVDKLSLSSPDQKFSQGGGIINRMYQEEDSPQHKDEEEESNQEVLDDKTTADDCNVENDER